MKNFIRSLVHGSGFHLSRGTTYDDLIDVIERLQPLPIQTPLIRIGARHDGGYLVPDDLDDIAACFSPGVGDVAEFETQIADRGIDCFMADHTVQDVPDWPKGCHFDALELSDRTSGQSIRLQDWMERHISCFPLKSSSDLILQMDIEGGEYAVLMDTPREVLARFRMMVIEFHGLQAMLSRESFPFFKHVFDKILQDFAPVHIHPNNAAGVSKGGGIEIPHVMEFTFYRRDRVQSSSNALVFPHDLDRPNIAQKRDIVLPEIWQR